MRYYIKSDLNVKIESGWPLPGAIDFQIGAVLVDDDTNLFASLCGAVPQLEANTESKLELSSHKRRLFELHSEKFL